ncbi:bifunctional phosphatase IMPL2, chloroplastic isoform X2 [Cryptomeria japonica]|uniref:bifunctional phosphatase IMPL2, chloroplastic isoform X2 n=1 Tax=Cryptomeria japonica TaxID=3369 RepID=UPI0027DA073A|nr:bifunctional phosphatase IMPL2, chloroplastic isoform X2 [Cryptomeria japonica]
MHVLHKSHSHSISTTSIAKTNPIFNPNKCPEISPISVCVDNPRFLRHPLSIKVPEGSTQKLRTHSAKILGLKNSAMSTENVEISKDMIEEFVEVGNKIADAAGQPIRQYFRKHVDIVDKDDLSPVTIADRAAEEAMRSVISEHFPTHAIYGEENGWTCNGENAEYIWVLDPIDGTKSFITGKPLFGTLIALVHKGIPILGIIDQPVLRERWIGKIGEKSTFNGQEISTRSCNSLAMAYMYTTSPHLFNGKAEEAFVRVRNKVKIPLYGCDCYAYALLASGHVDLVIESGLKLYDFLALVPVVEGAGGVITDWEGNKLTWKLSSDGHFPGFNVIAAGDARVHQEALSLLEWN